MSKRPSPRAYSSVRFSSRLQAEGGSQAHQVALSRAYCERKGLVLDDTLALDDLGVFALRGTNVRKGALAGFLEACRTGRVPAGSTLIVESLDRLSRDQIRPALQLVLQLQDHGVNIVTLQPEWEYPASSADALALIEPLIIFSHAHEESLMKSHRRKHGWDQAKARARAGGGHVMVTCPAWLRVTEGGKFEVIEEAAAAVRRVFALALDGLGTLRIAGRLTREGVPPIGNGPRWIKRYVHKILTDPAAMGTYQPRRRVREVTDPKTGKPKATNKTVPDGEPIPNHYPAVRSPVIAPSTTTGAASPA
jgi:DNA invertase Pin-like site-specific DNA recombinase